VTVPAASKNVVEPQAPPRTVRTGAHDRIRTGDLVLTKDTLYRLSYVGAVGAHYNTRKISISKACAGVGGVRTQLREGKTPRSLCGGGISVDWLFWLLAAVVLWLLFARG